MQITFTMLPEDIIRFSQYCAHTMPALQRKQWQSRLAFIAVAIISFWIFYAALLHSVFGLIPLSISITALYLVMYHVFFLDHIIAKQVERQVAIGGYSMMLGHQQLSLELDGYRVVSQRADTKHFWLTIQRITETNTDIYFFVDTTSAFIIPKRTFADETQCQTFLQEAQRTWDAAKESTTS